MRQVESERAALAGSAAQLNFAAQQAGQFAADRQPQAGAAVLAAGAGICLLEGLEDDALLLGRNADAGIGDLEGDDRGRLAQESDDPRSSRSWRPTRTGARRPASVNLNALDSRFFSTCCRRLESVTRLRARCGSVCTSKVELPVLRLVTEGTRHHLQQAGEEDFLRFDRDRAGFDLRQIENVADQVQQVGAGAVNGARELDLLGRQVAVRVVAELLAQHQNAVERRAQLVRHVGQEFGLVLRGERQFLGLLFQRAAGLLDFLVLAFDFDVLLGKLLRFLRQLLVGLLQLFLLRLQFGGQLLRLLQQSFGLHRGLNAVQHDADAGGQLFQERQMRGGEGAQRGQFDDRLDAIFEEHRQHDHVARNRFEQARANRNWCSAASR